MTGEVQKMAGIPAMRAVHRLVARATPSVMPAMKQVAEGAAPIVKAAAFSTQTAAFFDELTRMHDDVQKSRDEEIERATQRPFPNLLTLDEEPYPDYYRSPLQYNDEPEVILGRRIG